MSGALILDIAGLSLSRAERARLAHPLCGGVILFTRNGQSREQLHDLCTSIKAVRGDLLILCDQEGGRVQRFRFEGFTPLPPMARLGEIWAQDSMRALRLAWAVGYVMAAELRACGVDLSLAPVLDLAWGQSSVIGDRAFAADAHTVSMLAARLTQGMAFAGMAHCGKHFPGHGFAQADSHTHAAHDPRELAQIFAADARPYEWLSPGLAAVMPSHVIYPAVDAQPAGFSRRWLQEILRGQFGFGGAIISDDLHMQAARFAGDAAASARAALAAGCDLALYCNSEDGGAALLRALENSEADFNTPQAVARRRALLPATAAMDDAALAQDWRYQQARDLVLESLSRPAPALRSP